MTSIAPGFINSLIFSPAVKHGHRLNGAAVSSTTYRQLTPTIIATTKYHSADSPGPINGTSFHPYRLPSTHGYTGMAEQTPSNSFIDPYFIVPENEAVSRKRRRGTIDDLAGRRSFPTNNQEALNQHHSTMWVWHTQLGFLRPLAAWDAWGGAISPRWKNDWPGVAQGLPADYGKTNKALVF